jgi:uncharacterized repeat protein (TIGR02543 family)
MYVITAVACGSVEPMLADGDPGDDGSGTPDGGGGPAARLAIDIDDNDFGGVVETQVSAPFTFTVANSGDAASDAIATRIDGAPDHFAIVADDCTGTALAPAATCTIDVVFGPGAEGAWTGMLVVDGGGGGTVSATLRGEAFALGDLEITPATHDFGDVAMDTPSGTLVLTVENTGGSASGTLDVALDDPARFAIVDDTCDGEVLAPAATCTLRIQFRPDQVGQATASVTVTGDPGGTGATSMLGTGTARIAVTKSGSGGGTVSSTPAGLACGTTCDAAFSTPAVALAATPDAGHVFVGWTGACSGTGACDVSLASGDAVVGARFEAPQLVSVGTAGGGTGAVLSTPSGIDCGSDCSQAYAYGTSVSLAATPSGPSTFVGWSGACSGTGACTIVANAPATVTATFEIYRALTVATSPSGGGSVTGNGINCGADCGESYLDGTSVTLSAAPATGYAFAGWSGACTNPSGTCTVSMTADRNVTAMFVLTPKVLTVTKSPSGGGTVTSTPGGIDCGADCSESYTHGTSVVLGASPATGYTFTGWSGACTGTGLCTLSMTADRNVTATFAQTDKLLTVTKSPAAGGTITGSGINCGSDCTQSYTHGTVVTLTATPASGYTFGGWTGACTGSGSCTVTMNADQVVNATFTQQTPKTLTVTIINSAGGDVTSSPAGINCGTDCSQSYAHGTVVTLTRTVVPGWLFTAWTGACTGAGATCTVTMDAAKTVTARWEMIGVRTAAPKTPRRR